MSGFFINFNNIFQKQLFVLKIFLLLSTHKSQKKTDMKTKFTLIAALFLGLVSQMLAQTIVGTDPENKNVVLEEFTGIHCGYCPQGHAVAQAIYDEHPDDVVLIAIHTGGYASPGAGEPDFRTEFGSAIASQANISGYPAGTVNRHLFPGWGQNGGTAMGRGYWPGASDQTLEEAAYLNIACKATIVEETGQCSILVEVYYTGDSPESTNLLNVAVLQNNIIGYQSGGGNNYNHMHMLRHLITGQWGIEISETTQGSFYTTTLTYELPDNYNDIDVVVEDIDIVAFVSETHQEIVSGCMAEIIYPAASEYDVAIDEISFPGDAACDGELTPRIVLKNWGSEELTSTDIEYTINNGETATYTWTGNLVYPYTEEVILPTIPFNGEENNTLEVVVSNPNGQADENPVNNSSSTDFETGYETTRNISMELSVGYVFAGEVSWKLVDAAGVIVDEGGNYSGGSVIEKSWTLDINGCYTFFLMDEGENGFGGYLKLMDEGEVFVEISDELVDVVETTFHTDSNIGFEELSANTVSIYPNPGKNTTNISYYLSEASDVSVDVYSITGAQVLKIPAVKQNTGNQKMSINISALEEGIYFVSLNINGQTITKKVTVL